uniref:Uncharacterized protein n=1 Tax=Anguilla anguilla TaxID=7936 RepID=A0A0E9WXD8_ANGAN
MLHLLCPQNYTGDVIIPPLYIQLLTAVAKSWLPVITVQIGAGGRVKRVVHNLATDLSK